MRCPLPPSREGYRIDGKRKSATHRRAPPPSTWWPEYGLVASPVKAALRSPPPAAIGLDTACYEAFVCHQRIDGGIRPPPLTIHAEKAPSIFAQVPRMGTHRLFEVRVITLVDGCRLNETTATAQRGFSSCCRRARCIGPINYLAQNLGG